MASFETISEEAIYWRGVFLHRYAGVEYAITFLLIRAGGLDAYRGFGPLPYAWDKKLKRLAKIIRAPGPLLPYCDQIEKAVSAFTELERYRHIMAHGLMVHRP